MSAPLRKAPRRTAPSSSGPARETASGPASPATPTTTFSSASPTALSGNLPVNNNMSSSGNGNGAGAGRLFRRGVAGGAGTLGGGLSASESSVASLSPTSTATPTINDPAGNLDSDAHHGGSNAPGGQDSMRRTTPHVSSLSSGLGAGAASLAPQRKQTAGLSSSVPARHRVSGLTTASVATAAGSGLGPAAGGSGRTSSSRLQYGAHALLRETSTRTSSHASTPTGSVASLPLPPRGKHDSLTTATATTTTTTAGSPCGGSGGLPSGGTSNFTPLPSRLRLSDGISCMDYHPTFRALAVGGTRQIHVVEVSPNVAVEISLLGTQHSRSATFSAGAAESHSLPSLASATAPFGLRSTGTFGGLVKVESVVWYPSAAEATLAFVQPSRMVTVLLDALAFKVDGSYIPQQWIRSRCKALTSPVAAGSGSTTTAVVKIPGGLFTVPTATTTSAGSAGTATTMMRSPSAVGASHPTTPSTTTTTTPPGPTYVAPTGPSVTRCHERSLRRELIELNIDITYMRVDKIVWDPHTPYTLALTSPLTLFELWQVPVHGDRVFAPQLILRPPAHTTRVTVRDIEFSPSDPNLIVVMVETASAGQLLLFDRRQVEIPRHLDVMGPALAAAFHPLFADLLAVCYRKEKAKTDCRIAFLRVVQEDAPSVFNSNMADTASTGDKITRASAPVANTPNRAMTGFSKPTAVARIGRDQGSTHASYSAATTSTERTSQRRESEAASASLHGSHGAGGESAVAAMMAGPNSVGVWASAANGATPSHSPHVPLYPHVLLQDVLPPIDYYACVNRLLWRPTACGQLSRSRADHPWMTFMPDAQAVLTAPRASSPVPHDKTAGTATRTARHARASAVKRTPSADGGGHGGVDLSRLASQLWLATSAIANDLDVNIWDATNGYFPVCSVQYPMRDGREATNDFIWVNEVTLVSAVRGNEIVVSSLLSNTHLDRTVQAALATTKSQRDAKEDEQKGSHDTPTTDAAAAAAATALDKGEEASKAPAAPLALISTPNSAHRAGPSESALVTSMDGASRISTLYAFLPTASIAARLFGHVIAVRNSAVNVRRGYGDVMRRECSQLIQRIVAQLAMEREARRDMWEKRASQPAASPTSAPSSPLSESMIGTGEAAVAATLEDVYGNNAEDSPRLGPSSPLVWPQGTATLPPAAEERVEVATVSFSTASPVGQRAESAAAAAAQTTSHRHRHNGAGAGWFSQLFGFPSRSRARSAPRAADPSQSSTPSIAAVEEAAVASAERRGSPTFPARQPFPRPSGLTPFPTAGPSAMANSPNKANTQEHSPLALAASASLTSTATATVAATELSRTFLCLFPLLEAQQQHQQQASLMHGLAAGAKGPGAARDEGQLAVSPSMARLDHIQDAPHESLGCRGGAAQIGSVAGRSAQLHGVGTPGTMHPAASFATADSSSRTASAADVRDLTAQDGRRAQSAASVKPLLETFVLSDVVCNWAYAERETEQLKFMAYALEWDMGYELALSMKRLRRYRKDVAELLAQQQQPQPQSGAGAGVGAAGGWRRGAASPALPTSGSRRALTENDPSWSVLQKGLLARAVHGRADRRTARAPHGGGGDDEASPALFTEAQVDDLFAAMMLKNASICASQEKWVGERQRTEARAMNAATAGSQQQQQRQQQQDPISALYAQARPASGDGGAQTEEAGRRANGKVRAVTTDPRAQWWRAAAHAWRTHNMPFILAVAVGQLEYASLAGDVQYCMVLYILFCLWWRLRHEEAAMSDLKDEDDERVAGGRAGGMRMAPSMSGREMASFLTGAAVMDPVSVQHTWATHGHRLRDEAASSASPSSTFPAFQCPLCPTPHRGAAENAVRGTGTSGADTGPGSRSASPSAQTGHHEAGHLPTASSGAHSSATGPDLMALSLQLCPCTPAEWKLRALQWLGAYTNALYALRLYVPLNELLLIVPEMLQEPTNPVQPRAADISYEKQMTYVCCGSCAKSELIAAVPRGSGVAEAFNAGVIGPNSGRGQPRRFGFQRGLLDPLRAIRQAALAALRLHQERRRQQKQQRRRHRVIQASFRPSGPRVADKGGRHEAVVGGLEHDEKEDVVFSDRSSSGSSLLGGSRGGSRSGGGTSDDVLPYTTSSDDSEDGVTTPLVIELPAVVDTNRMLMMRTRTRGGGGEAHVPGANRLAHHMASANHSRVTTVEAEKTEASMKRSATSARVDNEAAGKSGSHSHPLNGDQGGDVSASSEKDIASWASTCASDEGSAAVGEAGASKHGALSAHALRRLRGGRVTHEQDDDLDDSASDEANLLAMAGLRDRDLEDGDGVNNFDSDDDDLFYSGEADTAVGRMRGHRLPENAVCPSCHDTESMQCVICEQVVEGLFYWLRSCGHGGHVHHMEEWLQLADECPRCGVPVSEVMRTAT